MYFQLKSFVFVCVGLVGGWLGMVGCQDRFCRNAYECHGYACNVDSVLCRSRCFANEDCDQSRGYVCQADRSCRCSGNQDAYCKRECFSDQDCERVENCLRVSRDPATGQIKSELLCACQEPCDKTNALCLVKKEAGKTVTTPTGAPKQCFAKDTQTTTTPAPTPRTTP